MAVGTTSANVRFAMVFSPSKAILSQQNLILGQWSTPPSAAGGVGQGKRLQVI
jgi:hypothetical protein